jgi:hypothetical protein
MKTKLSVLFLLGVMVALAAPTQVVVYGYQIDPARSGFVSLRGMRTSCTAVAVGPALLLAPASCINPSEVQHPELLGWFMAGQDSTENPVREVTLDARGRFALVRLAAPLDLSAAPLRLFRRPLTLPQPVNCVGYGTHPASEVFTYDSTLSQLGFVIGGSVGDTLTVDGPTGLSLHDLGAVCIEPGTRQIVAMMADDGLHSVAGARAWVEEYRANFEVVAGNSGLCLGNVPSSIRVWQMPCAADANSLRVNQRWLIRRIGDGGTLQIRPTRFPDLCLGVTDGSGADGAEVRFSGCLPDLTNPYPAALPTAPRAEQLWVATHLGGDAIRLRNNMTGKCLDVETLSFAMLRQRTCTDGQPNQRFFVNVDSFSADTHQLVPFTSVSRTLGVSGAEHVNGTPIILWRRNGVADQEFTMTRSADVAFQNIRTLWSGSCIDVPSASTDNVGLQQYSCLDGANQQFIFRWLPRQVGYRIHPRHAPGRCVTLDVGAPDGNPAMSLSCTGDIAGLSLDTQRGLVE